MNAGIIRSCCWYSPYAGRDRAPPREAIHQMLFEIEELLEERNMKPTLLLCQRWPASAFPNSTGEDFLACISVTVEPGELPRPMTSWFEWQHPEWQIAGSPPPMIAPPTAGDGDV